MTSLVQYSRRTCILWMSVWASRSASCCLPFIVFACVRVILNGSGETNVHSKLEIMFRINIQLLSIATGHDYSNAIDIPTVNKYDVRHQTIEFECECVKLPHFDQFRQCSSHLIPSFSIQRRLRATIQLKSSENHSRQQRFDLRLFSFGQKMHQLVRHR